MYVAILIVLGECLDCLQPTDLYVSTFVAARAVYSLTHKKREREREPSKLIG